MSRTIHIIIREAVFFGASSAMAHRLSMSHARCGNFAALGFVQMATA